LLAKQSREGIHGRAGREPETFTQRAEHARRLADLLPRSDPAAERLRAYADELGAEAAAREGDAT
jgi:hypothetical protein